MAGAREIPGIDRDTPYAAVAASIVSIRMEEVIEHSARALDTEDIEGVHDTRVATRRLRAALEVFRPCFPKREHKAVLAEVKMIADALGERRDRDVSIAALERFSEALAAPDRPGVGSLVEHLRHEQLAANEELVPFVAPERLAKLEARVKGLAAAAAA